jgi:NADH-quinone oxidoreductase subunit N
MGDLWLLIPEYLVLGGALLALFLDVVGGDRRAAARVGAVFAVAAAGVALALGPGATLFGGQLVLDERATFARVAIAALTAVWLLWVAGRSAGSERVAEATFLALISALGGMLIVSARDLVVLFIALELSTMPAYVLMGYRRDDARGLEGALKYFLLSMLTSLVMLYGLSFLYGIAGSTAYADLASAEATTLRSLGFVFALIGLFAKLSAAPFHYWTPDAYAGAPASSVAFVSTVPKVAGTVALVTLVDAIGGGVPGMTGILVAVAVASMLLGNLAAFPQTDVRRLMAYSGVAHTGYILLAVAAGATGGAAAVFYTVAYAIPSMAVVLLAAEEGTALADLGGLVARRPLLAWASVAWLLSLVGIPPMVGFFGKLNLFTAALQADLLAPVLVAVAMSVVSAGYYFRILRESFFGERPEAAVMAPSAGAWTAMAALTLAVLAMGVAASPLLGFLGVQF